MDVSALRHRNPRSEKDSGPIVSGFRNLAKMFEFRPRRP
jgi:hypothetical protein